ncbi:uncharacterized protein LOC119406990 [Rhipicephalus sanguineus]|uniref:uncharacterized protein LOC119406990 n=1 Tax=Rhipicephalus sanguineus TaxID=34632 RepID=UPI00189376F9|nr:uncharacterized protein LOC119406990 [Rhipicephalus sanguineus]
MDPLQREAPRTSTSSSARISSSHVTMFTAEEYYRYSMVYAREQEAKAALLKEILEEAAAAKRGEVPKKKKKKKKAKPKQIQGPVSTLSPTEHSSYMYLLQRYQHRVITNISPTEQKDLIQLAELQTRVVLEQQEFLRKWPHVPGRRPETLAKGCESWGRAQLTKLKQRWPKGPWILIESIMKVSLLKISPVAPNFLGHVQRKAGIIVQPEPGCALLELLPSEYKPPMPVQPHPSTSYGTPITAAFPTSESSGRERVKESKLTEDNAEDGLARAHEAILLVDLETLLIDWQESPWQLPFTITDDGVISMGPVLPAGTVRDWNERFFSYLLNKWIEARQKKGVVPEAGAAKVSAKQPMEQTVGSFVQVGAKHPAECPTKQLKKLRVGQPTGPVEIPLEETTEQPSGDIEMKSPSRDSLICTSPCSSDDLVIDEGLIASPSPAPTSVAASDSAAQADTAGLPCPEGDQGYDLWELTPGGKRVLLRHQAWNDSDGQLCMVTVKPEYQSLLGAEVLSTQEQVQQMARLAFFSRLLRVRVEVQSGHVLLVEEVKPLPDHKKLRFKALFGPLSALVDQLVGLRPGTYLLIHHAREPNAWLFTQGAGKGCNLHNDLDNRTPRRPSATTALGKVHAPPSSVPPLDPEVIFPDQFQRGRIPLTFPPARLEAVTPLAAGQQFPSWGRAGPSKVGTTATGTAMSRTPVTWTATSLASATGTATSRTPVTWTGSTSTPVTLTALTSTPATGTATSSTPVTSTALSSTPATLTVTSRTPATLTATSRTPATLTATSRTPATLTAASRTPATWTATSRTPATWTAMSLTPATWTATSRTAAAWTATSRTPATLTSTSRTPVTWTVTSSTPATWTAMKRTPATWTGMSRTPATWTGMSRTPATWTGMSRTPVTWTATSSTPVPSTAMSRTPVTWTATSSTPVTSTAMSRTPVTWTVTSSTPVTSTAMSRTPFMWAATSLTSGSGTATSRTSATGSAISLRGGHVVFHTKNRGAFKPRGKVRPISKPFTHGSS